MSSRLALGPTQPPIKWLPWGLTPGGKMPRHGADHSSPTKAEVENSVYSSTPHTSSWCSIQLVKHRDNFSFIFSFSFFTFYYVSVTTEADIRVGGIK
jgi:hypothetical protein